MLGTDTNLVWRHTDAGLEIEIPESLQEATHRPCRFAWGFQIGVEPT
jgi:hypothetical protein